MKKTFLQDLILPTFWLLFFMVSSKSERRIENFKKEEKTELRNVNLREATNGKEKEANFTKAIFLTGL